MRPVPEFDPKSWLLKALRETSHAMETLLWNLNDRALDRRVDADEWSCAELIQHMNEMERRFSERLDRIVNEREPRIAAFDADSIESDCEDGRYNCYDAMDEFASVRRQSVYTLRSLDDDDWERRGVHPYLGPLTIMQVAREMSEHDLAHLWQLRRLCDALAPEPVST